MWLQIIALNNKMSWLWLKCVFLSLFSIELKEQKAEGLKFLEKAAG